MALNLWLIMKNGDQVNYVMAVYQVAIVADTLKPDGDQILELGYFLFRKQNDYLRTLVAGSFISRISI